ncbi:MAG TPA: hypothetical protein VF310_08775, partial [Vicinamibacteria bacterium]
MGKVRGTSAGRSRLRLGATALLLALALLGALQYRWLREVADGQRRRMRADAAARAAAAAQDFDREITRAFLLLPLDGTALLTRNARAYAARLEEYRSSSRWPGLVRDVFARTAPSAGGTLLRFSPEEQRLVPSEWPAELEPLRAALEGRPGAAPAPMLAADVPALLLPVVEPIASLPPLPEGVPRAALGQHVLLRRAHARPLGPCTLLLLDRAALSQQVL